MFQFGAVPEGPQAKDNRCWRRWHYRMGFVHVGYVKMAKKPSTLHNSTSMVPIPNVLYFKCFCSKQGTGNDLANTLGWERWYSWHCC